MMTRKDYIKVAEILKSNNVSDKIISDFSHMFKSDNSNFDYTRFYNASKGE
jgi:hypothetical protein